MSITLLKLVLTISLDKLPDMQEYNKVNVKAKIANISPPQTVNGGKKKQEIVLADETGTATLTLWEADIDSLQLSQSYAFTKLVVRIFLDNHFLTLPMTGVTVTAIEDIPNASDAIDGKVEPTLYHAEVCGIKELESYKVCIVCDGKVLPSSDEPIIGHCKKCGLTQKMSHCKDNLMAKMIINGHSEEDSSSLVFTTLVAFGDILKTITQTDSVNNQTLLIAKPFTATYNGYNVLTSISRD